MNTSGAASPQVIIDFSNGMTMEAMVKFSSLKSGEDPILTFNGGSGGYMNLLIDQQRPRWEIAGGQSIFTTGSYTTDTWYVYTGTWDRATGEAKLYINGVLAVSEVRSCPQTSRTSIVEIGQRSDEGTKGIDGDVAVGRIYNRALSASEVLSNYNALIARVS